MDTDKKQIAADRAAVKAWPGKVYADVHGTGDAFRVQITKADALWLLGKGQFTTLVDSDNNLVIVANN